MENLAPNLAHDTTVERQDILFPNSRCDIRHHIVEHLGFTHQVLTHKLAYGDDWTSLRAFAPDLGTSRAVGIGVAAIHSIRVKIYRCNVMHNVERQKIAPVEHAAALKRHCPGWNMVSTHIHLEFGDESAPAVDAPYLINQLAPHYEDARPLVMGLVEANPEQILWSRDWPHILRMEVRSREKALRETPYLKVDDRAWLR
ncbi:hypothetical protein ACQKWADRAFT_323291 [Trichoderma austrokoningii]